MKIMELYNFLVKVKIKAILYTCGVLFFIGFTSIYYHQQDSISLWMVLEIFLVSFITCLLEPLCFKYLTNKKVAIIVWLIIATIIFISMACIGQWFLPLPIYAYILLFILFEIMSVLVYASLELLLTLDSQQLNKCLASFKQNNQQ